MSVCFKCRAPDTQVSLCTDCQLRISRLERDLSDLRRELGWVRKVNVGLMKTVSRKVNVGLKKAVSRKVGRPKSRRKNKTFS